MIIKNIKIQDFKSIYGEQTFDFESLKGLIKLSGVVGSGKTTLGEAILWGLFGDIKDLKQDSLIAWHAKTCCVDINLTSRNHEIFIHRDMKKPLEVKVDGKLLAATNKKKTQELLETEYYDVPRLAIEKMCIVSFNSFANSIAKLNPAETKRFLDEIFGFEVFTLYNDEIVLERKEQTNENFKLTTVLEETDKQISYLQEKKSEQQSELENKIDVDSLNNKREELINEGKKIKEEKESLQSELSNKDEEIYKKMTEAAAFGRQEKEYYNTFKSGKCPTCGQKIDEADLESRKQKMMEYADLYNKYKKEREDLNSEYEPKIQEKTNKINDIKKEIQDIDRDIKVYENNLKVIKENYDDLINEYKTKSDKLKEDIKLSDKEIGEWNEMNELFSKTFRYNLLNTLIPHINKSIQYFINKFDLQYVVKFDEEFKCHIYVDGLDNEITYNNLSTGQKKQVDLAIIFGILQNIIANVDFNLFFLDELASNCDTDTRNILLKIINDTFDSNKTIFMINHAEMQDDYFKHKIRVALENKKILNKKNEIVVKSSKYTKIF